MTTNTQPLAPTDADIDAAWRESVAKHETTAAFVRDFARAVLTKWGNPAPAGVEPVASVHRDSLAMLNSGQVRPWDGGARLYPASKARFDEAYVGVYTNPHPVEREPLTDEQIQEAILPINPHGMGYFLRIARAIERAHGIGIKNGDSNGLKT